MSRELRDSFAEAWNASARAVELVVCFLLMLAIYLLEVSAHALRCVHTWVKAGAKLPDWVLPRRQNATKAP